MRHALQELSSIADRLRISHAQSQSRRRTGLGPVDHAELLVRNMGENADNDYVLGTNDEELDRLGLQHRVWRPIVLECWRRAGITHGWRVIDAGAGPGYAT